MPFVLIKGAFHVEGYSPDGDSVRFEAEDAADWEGLSGPPVRLNARGHAQLRFEGIDTPETHYRGEHQPLGLATGALERLLTGLGITGVGWDDARTEITADDDGAVGHVLSRAADDYGRPVQTRSAIAQHRAAARTGRTRKILHRPQAPEICASARGYAVRVATGSKLKKEKCPPCSILGSSGCRGRSQERAQPHEWCSNAVSMQDDEWRGETV